MATDKLVEIDHVTDFISREAAYKTLTEYYHHSSGVQHTVLREALNRVPSADVRPVVRGEWWPAKDGYYGHVMCSACHKIESHETDFCPECGCQMNGGRK